MTTNGYEGSFWVDKTDYNSCCTTQYTKNNKIIYFDRMNQNAKFKVWFLLNAYCFHTIIKSKHFKWIHQSQGPSVHYMGELYSV